MKLNDKRNETFLPSYWDDPDYNIPDESDLDHESISTTGEEEVEDGERRQEV